MGRCKPNRVRRGTQQMTIQLPKQVCVALRICGSVQRKRPSPFCMSKGATAPFERSGFSANGSLPIPDFAAAHWSTFYLQHCELSRQVIQSLHAVDGDVIISGVNPELMCCMPPRQPGLASMHDLPPF